MIKSVKDIIEVCDDCTIAFLYTCYFVIYDAINNTQFVKEMEYIYMHKEKYTIDEVAEKLNLSRSTLYDHIKFINKHFVACKKTIR